MCHPLVPYEISPQKIDSNNWRHFLGNKHCCLSYRDFFYEQLKSNETQWKNKFIEFLLDNQQQQPPLINSVISGLTHPLIHIGYAFELDNLEVATEALTLTAVSYNYLHEYIDTIKPPRSPSKTAFQIFEDIHSDSNFPIYETPGVDNLESTIKDHSKIIFHHYNQWLINRDNLDLSIEELFDLTVYIYGATHKPNDVQFDFFLLHLLTSMHAIRIISPHITDKQICEGLLHQFFFFAIALYVTQLRPKIDRNLIDNYEVNHDWNYVIDRALNTNLRDDAHAVKVIRAVRDAEQVYGNKTNFYLKTAVKTVETLNIDDPWIGGSEDKQQLNILKN